MPLEQTILTCSHHLIIRSANPPCGMKSPESLASSPRATRAIVFCRTFPIRKGDFSFAKTSHRGQTIRTCRHHPEPLPHCVASSHSDLISISSLSHTAYSLSGPNLPAYPPKEIRLLSPSDPNIPSWLRPRFAFLASFLMDRICPGRCHPPLLRSTDSPPPPPVVATFLPTRRLVM